MRNKKKKQKQKRVTRAIVLFAKGSIERLVTRMAMGGASTAKIMRKTGLTESRVNYRLAKAKREGDYSVGFRQQWRNGNNPLFDQFMDDYQAVMEAEIDDRIEPNIEHPTPEVVKVEE